MGRCFNTCLSEHKQDLKPINMTKLKAYELNKKNYIHCFKYEHRIDFVSFEILNFNIGFEKKYFGIIIY